MSYPIVGQQQQEVPVKFAPTTVINSSVDGIQLIISTAPQVTQVVWITVEQMKTALERCVQLRQQQQTQHTLPVVRG